jgi:hypothetical protein
MMGRQTTKRELFVMISLDEGFATDASMIKAGVQRQRSCPGDAGIDWG